jgi:hypothetical protein
MAASGLGVVGTGMEEILSSSASICCEISSTPFALFLSLTPGGDELDAGLFEGGVQLFDRIIGNFGAGAGLIAFDCGK